MADFRLYKKEKLRSRTSLEQLFTGKGSSSLVYPWRAVWRVNEEREPAAPVAQFAIIVPKRRLRHAVDRVLMRRRMREAYRLHRSMLPHDSAGIEIVFVYVASAVTSYDQAQRSVIKLMERMTASLTPKASVSDV